MHTAVASDTLYSISQRYKIPMRDIAVYNNLAQPFDLSAGQRIKLPPPREYKTRPGDSLYTVSRLFGVNTSDISQLNNLRSPYTLTNGQVLRLPSVVSDVQNGEGYIPPAPGSPAIAPVTAVEVMPLDAPPVVANSSVPPTMPPQPAGVVTPPAVAVASAPVVPEKRTPITAKTPKRASSKFLQPVNGKILSGYGPKKDGLHNDGINIGAPNGTPIRSAENGVIVYSGSDLKGSGNLVIIRHADRWMTAYAHMGSVSIKRGDVVKRGQTIGTVGTTGSVDSPQLHFEVRRGTEALNPKLYVENQA